jgi:hypothetical protein
VWEKTIARIKPPLSSQLLHTQVEFKGDDLFVTLNGGHAALFEDSIKSNLKTIEKIVAEEAGRTIKITLVASPKKVARKKNLKEKVMDKPLIREALELFDGRIVEVIPMDNPGNKKNGGNHV